MKAYDIALFFIIFCAASGMVNDYMSYEVKVPEYDVGISDAQIEDLTDSTGKTSTSELSMIDSVWKFGGIFFAGLQSALIIAPVVMQYGVPLPVAGFFNAIIWFVYAAALVQYFSNRSMKTLE